MGNDTRRKIIKTVGYIPVIICIFLLGWSYYAYNIVFCFFILPEVYDSLPLKIILSVLSHLLLLLCVWSYLKVVFVHPGKPDKSRKVFEDVSGSDDSTYDASHPVIEPHQIPRILQGQAEVTPTEPHRTSSVGQHLVTVKSNGEKRYCRKCDFEKPDRTHHCSICDECILKMDHHCPWINNCVGFHNQKYFLLFILYTTLYCIVVAVSLIPGFYSYTQTNHILTLNEFQLVFLCLVSVMFGIVLLCFTGYNFHLLLTNRSTIENMESTRYKGDHADPTAAKSINVFNVGYQRNFREVMGNSPYLWFLPVATTLGDGMLFPLSARAYNLLSSRD